MALDDLPVLVVATEPDVSVLTSGLRRAGYAFNVAATSDAVFREVHSTRYGVVVIDESLLPENPALFFRAIRQDAGTPVIVAGWGGADTLTEMLLNGADIYLTRPIPDEVLVARVQSLSSRTTWPHERPPGNNIDLFTPPDR